MQKYINNNRGLTLVEILAALIILSLVFIAFMTFFSQSAKFTMHNKEKLTAVQVAEDVVAIIRTNNEQNVNNICVEIKSKVQEAKSSDVFKSGQTESESPTALMTINEICENYVVKINLTKKLPNLGRALITVTSETNNEINNPEFITEMYFEVPNEK